MTNNFYDESVLTETKSHSYMYLCIQLASNSLIFWLYREAILSNVSVLLQIKTVPLQAFGAL